MDAKTVGREAIEPTGVPRRTAGRRPFLVGFAVSFLVHLAVVGLYPLLRPLSEEGFRPFVPSASTADGTRVVQIVEIAAAPAVDPDAPIELEEPEVEVVPEAPVIGDDAIRFPDRFRSPAERIRAGQGDPRLWRPLERELVEPTAEEVARLRVLVAIEAMADSAAAEAERQRRATDWTYTDDDGNRWGVSPGTIHLGGVSIPLPFGFGPPPDYNGERADRAFQLNDIDRAAGTRAAQQSWKDRRKVMKERREARRAAELEAAERRPPVVKPDTTRGRR